MSSFEGFLETPPLGDLTDFDTFASAMTTAPLDDLHKYLDSDDEQNLEDNFEGNDSDKENAPEDHAEGLYHRYNPTKYQPHIDLDKDSDDDNDSDDDDLNNYGQSQKYDYFDPRLDIDLSRLRPSHAASRHLNPHIQKTIDKTELMLEQLSIQAQPILEEQPLSTQIILANQALDQVFKPYGTHGSQAQFSASVMKFLSGGDTVRRPGKEGRDKRKDGKLRFAEVDPAAKTSEEGHGRREKLKRKVSDEGNEKLATNRGQGSVLTKMPKEQLGDDVGIAVKKHTSKGMKKNERGGRADHANLLSERAGCGSQPASTVTPALDGLQASVDSLSFRKTSGPLDMLQAENGNTRSTTPAEPNLYLDDFESINLRPRFPQSGRVNATPASRTPFTPLASTFSESLRLQTSNTPNCLSPPPPLSRQSTPNPHVYSCTFDPAANAALAREAYNPISLKFSWPATTRADGRPCMPTPGLLDALNNILHLHNAEARFMLSYYVRKYDFPAHKASGSAGGTGMAVPSVDVEPPHALFRLGIAQYLMSKVGKAVENKESNELGLNPEARRVLGEVWERHPGTGGAWFDGGLFQEGTAEAKAGDLDEGEHGYECENDGMAGRYEAAADHIVSEPETELESPEIDDASNNGLSPHSQRSLNARKPADGIGGLNPLEKALLARACNVSVETVEAYWDDMRWKTRGWGAMKAWCTAQDKLRIARIKAEGRW